VEIIPGHQLPEQEKTYQKAIVDALSQAIRGIKESYKEGIVSSIGSNLAVVRQVQYPVAVKDKLLSAIQWEARKFIPYEPEEVVVDAQILSIKEDTGKMEVLLAAVPKEHLKHHQDVLSGVGVESTTVDTDSIALMNALKSQITLQTQETALLIDVGARTTILNLYQEDGLFFTRSLSIAGDRFTQEISANFGVSFSQAEVLKRGEVIEEVDVDPDKLVKFLKRSYKQLYSEIHKSILFYNKQTGVKDFNYMFLCGGGANLPGLKEFLSEKMGTDIALLSPVTDLKVDEKNITKQTLTQFGSQIAMAIGLALRMK
jgi:type IV pilus assembly protein PilM